MSHYCKINTQIVEVESLLKALDDLGFKQVEQHSKPVNLFGYKGDIRPEQANIVVRRQFISQASNDIGFKKTDAGTYEAVVSEYDFSLLGADFVDRICRNYAYHAVLVKLEEQGFAIDTKTVDAKTKKVHLVLKRSTRY